MSKLVEFLWTVVSITFRLAFTGLAVGIVFEIFAPHDRVESWSLLFTLVGFGSGFITGIAVFVRRETSARRKTEAATLREYEAARKLETDTRARGLERSRDEASKACTHAVEAFERLHVELRDAREFGVDAEKHFSNGAYSPFWQAIENAYVRMGQFNSHMLSIERMREHYAMHRRAYHSDYNGEGSIDPFPVQVDAVKATERARDLVEHLNAVVYKAQQDAVFAQIWEQRRTTSAVVAGFTNLEQAVYGMSATISSSVASLSSSVSSLNKEVRDVGHRVTDSSTSADAIASDQLATQRALTSRVNKAVHYLEEEHQRATRFR